MKNIVLLTDFSIHDAKAAEYLEAMFKTDEPYIHLCHVSSPGPVLVPDLISDVKENRLLELLCHLKANITYKNISGSNLGNEILHYAKTVNADFIAVVKKKHTLWNHLFATSHINELIEELKLPLLIIPEHWYLHHNKI